MAVPALVESAPADVSAPVVAGAPFTDIEAVRAQNYEFRAPSPFTDIGMTGTQLQMRRHYE